MARKSRKYHSQKALEDSPQQQVWRTAVYARISREDTLHETIETQIGEVKRYIESRPFFKLVGVYADDGWSGSNFQRPSFERLMEDIRNLKIDCIIVKDLSRFAREHIGAEDYLNNIFPFLGIRFIAIRDNYDNIEIEPQEYFLASFKNFANAHFAKETSRKVSQAKRLLQEQGKFIGSTPPYGYKRDFTDKHKLIPDEEKAEIVREIFARNADGESYCSICNDLNNRGIFANRGGKWSAARLRDLLTSECYIGTLVQRTTVQALYKSEEKRITSKDEQIRFENAFEPLVKREIWDKVQARIADRKTTSKGGDKK